MAYPPLDLLPQSVPYSYNKVIESKDKAHEEPDSVIDFFSTTTAAITDITLRGNYTVLNVVN
jgi:hypothetical protein